MVDFRDSFERAAWRLLAVSDPQNELGNSFADARNLAGSYPNPLFRGRVDRHLLRAYRNGMSRCFEGLACAALSESVVDGGWLQEKEGWAPEEQYGELCRHAFQLQSAWPVGREIHALLNDCRLQRVRAKALVVELATMAVRLSPSLQRRIVLVRALHERGRFREADSLMASIISKPISSDKRMDLWSLQSSMLRARGFYKGAHVASRAALSCDSGSPAAWCGWLLTAALTGSVQDLREAGQGLADACRRDPLPPGRFQSIHAGRYSEQTLRTEWLRGLPKIAQQTLWVAFTE